MIFAFLWVVGLCFVVFLPPSAVLQLPLVFFKKLRISRFPSSSEAKLALLSDDGGMYLSFVMPVDNILSASATDVLTFLTSSITRDASKLVWWYAVLRIVGTQTLRKLTYSASKWSLKVIQVLSTTGCMYKDLTPSSKSRVLLIICRVNVINWYGVYGLFVVVPSRSRSSISENNVTKGSKQS